MWHKLRRTLLLLVAGTAMSIGALSASPAQAWFGHHWGHHHYGGFGGYYGGFYGGGFPSYGYSSFYYAPRFRPYYSTYSVGYSYYVPRVSYSVALPTYYAAPTYYVAPSYYVAPTVYPSVSTGCCDPCASSVTYPSSSTSYPSTSYPSTSYPSYSTPTYSQPSYSTGVAPSAPTAALAAPQLAGGSFVDRMLGHTATASHSPAASPVAGSAATYANRQATPNVIPANPTSGVRTVSTAKPAVNLVGPLMTPNTADVLTPLSDAQLSSADQLFANARYTEAAAAYARLAVRFGNHEELSVRRFIALVASGDHAQAAVVLDLAQADGQPLLASVLPAGSLAQLYGSHADLRKQHIDSLANFALQSEGDALPLSMVGTWLSLDSQSQRAELFFEKARRMTSPTSDEAMPVAARHLADSHVAR